MSEKMSEREEYILTALTVIFRENFDDESLVITPETSQSDIEEWDSLEQINLFMAVEERFAVKFDPLDIHNLTTVGDFIRYIRNNEREDHEWTSYWVG